MTYIGILFCPFLCSLPQFGLHSLYFRHHFGPLHTVYNDNSGHFYSAISRCHRCTEKGREGGKKTEFEITSGICVGKFLTQSENVGGLHVTDV